MLKITILAYDNCLQSGIAGMLDLLTLANWEQKRLSPDGKALFCQTKVVTFDGEPVTSFNRQQITANSSLAESEDMDLIIVPGVMGRPDRLLEQSELVKWIGAQHQNEKVVASACSGAFLLAEAGILKNRQATTHWQLADRFRQRFPKTDLQINRLLVDGGDYLCAGGTGAHIDLALYLIEKYGSKSLARACARMMLIDTDRRDQAPFIRFKGCREHIDEPILKVQQWLDRYYREKISVRVMAKRSGLNERTFLRRFKNATGEAPLEYLQKMRIEKAKQLLTETGKSLTEITQAVGYVDLSSFRRLFRQVVGISPTAYRQRFKD
ncbi:helix-turn-helix domain-containing protein [uncultured Desulfuromusa sp.]|uniref:GlxA family transcriptional regulator n=1 Tax=uncultured Desulfuromusa sp. TaxID=219183 RepID=UPI002AA69C62|nr:helix-turn-helix domain-containing protein [uncultured Desulfuromusa sp.]